MTMFPLAAVLALLLQVPAVSQAGETPAVGANPTIATFWNGNDCQGKADILRLSFGLDLNQNPNHIGRFLKAEVGEIVTTVGLPLERESSHRYLGSISLCVADSEKDKVHASRAYASINVLSLIRFHRDSQCCDAVLLPIDFQIDLIDQRDARFVPRDHVVVEGKTNIKGLIFPEGACVICTLKAVRGERQYFGTFVFYDLDQRAYRSIGAKIVVDEFSKGWEVIENSPPVKRFHSGETDIAQRQSMLQENYLLRCGGFGWPSVTARQSSEAHSVSPDDDAMRRNDVNNRASVTGLNVQPDGQKGCEIEITY